MYRGFPLWFSHKDSTCNAEVTGETVQIPWSGRSPGGGSKVTHSVFLPEKCHGQSSLAVHSVVKGQTQLKPEAQSICTDELMTLELWS